MSRAATPAPAIREAMIESQRVRALNNLKAAVKTARDAVETAERELQSPDPAIAAQEILRALTWGHANAMSSLQGALAAIEEMHELHSLQHRDLLAETLQPGAYGIGSTLAERIEAAVSKAEGKAAT